MAGASKLGYPRYKFHWTKDARIVRNPEEEAALGPGWAETPAAFAPYQGPRPARNEQQLDPVKWVDEWQAPGLSSALRHGIKAEIWTADRAFWMSPDAPFAVVESMRRAYDGIAGVLFEAGILTASLLQNEITVLVWDSAAAGGWWRSASETFAEIFTDQFGHYWYWRDDSEDWPRLFKLEMETWLSRLPAPSAETPLASAPAAAPDLEPETPAQFASEAARKSALADYSKSWTCSEAAFARRAKVNPSDLCKWKKGLLPASSGKIERIENVLKNNEPPILAAGALPRTPR